MEILKTAFVLILVMAPFGNIPVFASQLKNVDPSRVTKIICREAIIALFVLSFFLFAGEHILSLLDVSKSSLGIAGAVMLFIIAQNMVFSKPVMDTSVSCDDEPFIFPLAIPCIAGPSGMAILILKMASAPEKWLTWFIALLLAWGFSTLVLLLSRPISRLVGKRGLAASEKLMGLLLTAIAIQMFISGITTIIKAM